MKIKYYFDYFFIFACLIGSSFSILNLIAFGSLLSLFIGMGNFLMAYLIAEAMISDKELDAKRGKKEQ